MWICSQNKCILKECKFLVTGSQINENNNAIYEFINENVNVELGRYATEERAKEVLHQIRRQLETRVSSDCVYKGTKTIQEAVFQMPRE